MNPDGLVYEPEFISAAEEAVLLEAIRALPLEEARYRQFTAKRRVAIFDGPPEFLVSLRDRLAAWMELSAADVAFTLINEYRPGTALGWHRDSPEYESVAGVSLGAPCRMRFRRWPPSKGRSRDALELALAPRSAYIMRGAVRWRWQHCVPAVKELRYSITFRSSRTER
ncbi:MAG TPA: alpha-ketoglutarate-dependent dioxygenase AlkB [Burkholderiales bacterium]|nr:alpha-ketoglutarate-dependent dioxygenase AlkB [Burkholderiales bacterium]